MTTREIFEKGTNAFNTHDIDGFAGVLAEDVVFDAPGICGEGKTACVEFFRSWFVAFPDAHVVIHGLHILDDVAVEEDTFTGTHKGVLRGGIGDVPPTGRSVRVDYIQSAPLPRWHARFVPPDIRLARDAPATWPNAGGVAIPQEFSGDRSI